ncbi:MAG: hypothetical protein D6798_10005 [Deltaproteobacteria bacterium]|nr:MAG: hypothetical protein D6798_10005 [Deltaproteobacteria bacterium]
MATSNGRRLRDVLVRAFTENLPLKVLSLLFATMLWAWVQSDQVVEVRTRATVAWSWPDGLVPSRQVPSTLVVTVSGPQGVVRQLKRGTLSLAVDLHDSPAGTVAVDFGQIEVAGLPPGVEVVQVSPPAVDIDLEKAITKEVEVRPTIIGEPADGYTITDVRSEPPTVHIVGPQSRVQELAQVATDVVNVAGLAADRQYAAALAIPDPVLRPAEGAPRVVRVQVEVEPIIAERVFDAVPVQVDEDGLVAEPATARVTVRGPQADLERIRLDGVRVVVHEGGEPDANGMRIRRWRPGGQEIEVRLGRPETEGEEPDAAPDTGVGAIEIIDVSPRSFTLTQP